MTKNKKMESHKIKNVVLVHGAFADASSFKGLFWELTRKGFNVCVVQNPLTSLEDAVLATHLELDRLDGTAVLVGHSWGGAVITEAGNHPKVKALVYIAAFQPDGGESALQWLQTVVPTPENGVLPPDEKGIVYYSKEKYHEGFCADVDESEAEFMCVSQGAFYAKGLATVITNAAWRHKPAFAVIATQDKSIDPKIQRNMYERSHTITIEVEGSHAVYISQPKKVADLIAYAAEFPG
jgi:pimeloyl-ACP methyl ester carboxylesterase